MDRTLSPSLLAIVIVLSELFSFRAIAQVHFNADERRIITITDERRDADSLLPYLTSPDINVARRAAIGIGNIGDTSVREKLIEYFKKETRDTVADAEAFAMGLLGDNRHLYFSSAILAKMESSITTHGTAAKLLGLVRSFPHVQGATAELTKAAEELSDMSETKDCILAADLLKHNKIDSLDAARVYVAFSLRKYQNLHSSTEATDDITALASCNNPEVRWRIAYALSREADSTDLAGRISSLHDLLLDQGSPDARMFAALAFGKLHNAKAAEELDHAYRGEDEWRVRINILRAFGMFPTFDSLAFDCIRLGVESALRDSTLLIHVGITAGDVLDQLIAAGKLRSSDSIEVRDWLDGFSGTDNRNQDVDPIVNARLTVPAARLRTPTYRDAIQNYASYRDIPYREYAAEAAGTLADTEYFIIILGTIGSYTPPEQVARLNTLDSLWQHARKDPKIRSILEKDHMADIFRGLLIHISDVVVDPSVAATALEELRDTSIIKDSTRHDTALAYIQKYIPRFSTFRFRDALIAAIETDKWLGDNSQTIAKELRIAYDSANTWHDAELMDTIANRIHAIEGPKATLPAPLPRISRIDWDEIESLPENMVINFMDGPIQLHLLTYEAPLTVWNMVKLSREQFFAGNIVHRVVPNFVIQSGDPTATGWGGPGYAMRSEITPREYDRAGTVGMASSGKDTEGSQWFITECPTPHLDTRYTIWAEVTDGLPIVFQRKMGDIVSSIIAFQ